MDLSKFYVEFLTIAAMHLVAVASPGPDFAIVMKHSISHGKKIALITSVGIGLAIFIHVAYALLGIGLIINTTPWLYDALIVFAAGCLVYIAQGAVKSPKPAEVAVGANVPASNDLSAKKAFFVGFMTNGLNPKATLFFLSLFTVTVSQETPILVKSAYGVYLAVATTVWFCCLSLVLTHSRVRQLFSQKGYVFDRIMGWLLIFLAAHIMYSEIISKYIN